MNNWRTHIVVLLVMSLGFFLMPEQTHACSSKKVTVQQSACKGMKAVKHSAKGSCCKGKKHKKECDGKCKSCVCSNAPASYFSLLTSVNSIAQHPFAQLKKQIFIYKPAYYSSGYFSIWLPPKIS